MPDKNDLYVTVIAVLAIALWFTLTGRYSARVRSTPDFLWASRMAGPRWNAAAISGEYLSAASFLGIAGLVFKGGVDALWYPVGFAAGYLAMLLFVAAPLRRSGAYTLPDFAEIRLNCVRLRWVCTAFVVIIGWLYLVPQLQGAGLTLQAVTDQPKWVGATVVMVIATFNIYSGRLRSITIMQAFQYWIKLTALAVPVFVLLIHNAGEDPGFRNSLDASAPPSFSQATEVTLDHDVELQVTEPVRFTAVGRVDGQPVQGVVRWERDSKHRVGKDTTLYFDAGSPVPVVDGATGKNSTWLRPMSYGKHPLLATYSLLVALLLGTMGLPQVLGRYYTDPDGRTARRTTLLVLVLLGVFYLFPTVSGWLARLYVPQLLVNGNTDAALLMLPRTALGGWPALLLGGLIEAGAFAAFVSAATGLVVSVAGVLSTDVLPGRLRDFRVATLAAWSVPLVFVLAGSSLDLAQGVELAFAVAASSFCPLLVLGIWWRGLTDAGAAAGILAGGGLAVVAVLLAAAGVLSPGWQTVLAQPAVFTVPLAFLSMVMVSRRTRDRVPADVSRILLRLHAPDRLGLAEKRELGQLKSRVGIIALALSRMPLSRISLSRIRIGRHRRPA
ncbi:MAG: cation acetate symporter [Pseudonocardiales bacterium]|nr:cation acetate symporter [Pseudonocardiales bacterium]